MAEFFVVRVNLFHGEHARIFRRAIILAGALFVPIENAADERRDELRPNVSARNRLRERKEQSHVAIDSLFLKDLGRLNTFPGRGELDQNSFPPNPVPLIESDEFSCLGQQRVAVER